MQVSKVACIMAAAFNSRMGKMFIQWGLEALSNVTLLLNNLLLSFHECF